MADYLRKAALSLRRCAGILNAAVILTLYTEYEISVLLPYYAVLLISIKDF